MYEYYTISHLAFFLASCYFLSWFASTNTIVLHLLITFNHFNLHLTHSSLNWQRVLLQCHFLCGLCFLSENWLGLSTKTRLLHVVPSSALSEGTFLALLVLGHFTTLVTSTFSAICLSIFWDVHHLIFFK